MDRDESISQTHQFADQGHEARRREFDRIARLHSSGRLAEAEQGLLAWIARHADFPEAYFRLGAIALETGRAKQALSYLEQAARLAPAQPSVLGLLANTLHSLGRLDEATACYRKLIAVQPNLLQAYNNLGLVLKEQGKLGESIEVLKAAVCIRPDYATALTNLASVLQAAGRSDEARATLIETVRRQPNCVEAWANLGMIYANESQTAAAAHAFDEAVRLAPGDAGMLHQIARTMEGMGAIDRAIELLRRSLVLAPSAAPSTSIFIPPECACPISSRIFRGWWTGSRFRATCLIPFTPKFRRAVPGIYPVV